MRSYRFVDWITQGYASLVVLLLSLFHDERIPNVWLYVGAHLVLMALVHGLVQWSSRPGVGRPWVVCRQLYPVLLFIGFYRDTGLINRALNAAPMDKHLILMEHALLGYQPSVDWMQRLPWVALSETLYAAYFSFYLMIAGLAVWFQRRRPEVLPHFIGVISFLLYSSYVIYFFLPAVGPRSFFQPGPERELFLHLYGREPAGIPPALQGWPMERIMHWIYENLETWGAAFPSSHVAVAFGTAWFSWRYVKLLRWFHPALAVLLTLSTIYCRYHYAVDAFAGLLMVGIFLPLGNRLYSWSERQSIR